MRDIKFRALNSSTHEWEYGNLLKLEPNTIGEYFINIAHPFAFDPNVRQTACIAGTEGQYVGLKDKNGVEIYEDSLFKHFELDRVCKCVNVNGAFGYYDSDDKYAQFIAFATNRWYKWENGKSDNIEVVGDIHTTPELLTS